MTTLYDPLTYDNLMAGLALHFHQRTLQPPAATLDADVQGPGVYALFYAGSFAAYETIANAETPIYVGKAVPPGSRKGAAQMPQAPRCGDGCGNMPSPSVPQRICVWRTSPAST